MEGYKTKIPTDDPNMLKAFRHIEDNAMGNIIIAKEQPTSKGMHANTMMVYEDALYIKFANGDFKKATLTDG